MGRRAFAASLAESLVESLVEALAESLAEALASAPPVLGAGSGVAQLAMQVTSSNAGQPRPGACLALRAVVGIVCRGVIVDSRAVNVW